MAAWRFMRSASACIMIGFRSDHACIMHKSETDWMHARGQPASARAWPAASRQRGTHPKVNKPPILNTVAGAIGPMKYCLGCTVKYPTSNHD